MKTERFKLAGCSYYQDNIMTLAAVNPDYDMPSKDIKACFDEGELIPEYKFLHSNCELVPEPSNQYDANAVKVMVDNVHVGYIKAGSCSHVKKLLADKTVRFYVDEMGMGNYKKIIDGRVEEDSFNRPFVTLIATYGEEEPPKAVSMPEAIPKPIDTPQQPPINSKANKIYAFSWRLACILWLLFGLLMLIINPFIGICVIAMVILIFIIMKKRGK